VDLYTPLLYHWARRAGLQEQDAADLVQDVLTLLVRKLPEFTYDRQRSFRSWLRTVTLNKLREKQRRPSPVLLETGARPEDILGPDELQALEDAEHHRHLIQHVLKVIEPDFPPLCWKAFQEYVVAGREAAEVAAELHVRIGTVYAAKSRILARLRQELNALLE
jgi:RNA polymerase sigma-70 factor (ECF subfamily)